MNISGQVPHGIRTLATGKPGANPGFSPGSVARASRRRCAGAHGLQDAEGIV